MGKTKATNFLQLIAFGLSNIQLCFKHFLFKNG